VSTCPAGFYNDPTTFTCLSCNYTCGTCSGSIICNTCSTTSNRILINGTCEPAPGYYDNGTSNAVLCVSPCSNCTSATVCISCLTGNYLSGTTCVPCSTTIANCTQCDVTGNTCSLCAAGFIYNSATNLCDLNPCVDSYCLSCPVSLSVCVNCTPGFGFVSGVCTSICGDSILVGT
jgi:hypothetical protein